MQFLWKSNIEKRRTIASFSPSAFSTFDSWELQGIRATWLDTGAQWRWPPLLSFLKSVLGGRERTSGCLREKSQNCTEWAVAPVPEGVRKVQGVWCEVLRPHRKHYIAGFLFFKKIEASLFFSYRPSTLQCFGWNWWIQLSGLSMIWDKHLQ